MYIIISFYVFYHKIGVNIDFIYYKKVQGKRLQLQVQISFHCRLKIRKIIVKVLVAHLQVKEVEYQVFSIEADYQY
jgi:hypothetical protein